MKSALIIIVWLCVFAEIPACLFAQPPAIAWQNGKWFNGTAFISRSFYSYNGLLSETAPSVVDTIIDLQGAYIIPPFGEAHNHAPESETDIDVFIERYLADGIFYIKNPNSIPLLTQGIRSKINRPKSVDVVYANGGLTGSGGHPVGLYDYLKKTKYREALGQYAGMEMEGKAYYVIDAASDLEKKWPAILADSPAFIKTYLLYSEEFAKRKNDPAFSGKKGMDPALLPAIVQKARAAGRTVSCHVETPADLTHALRSGVTEVNHLPGYQVRWREGYDATYYLLSKTILKQMKKAGAHADATYSLSETELQETDSTRRQQQWEIQKANLQQLKKYKIPVTIGCDSYNKTSRTEIEYLMKMQIYSPLELLKMWCETTPKAIYPNRNIAALKEGYEASFLVLKENPLRHPDAMFRIGLRIKQGHILW